MRKLAISALLFSWLLTAPALAQTSLNKMSADQAREEHAHAIGVQTAIWGRPFVDNVHTLYAGLKAGAVGLSYYRKFPNLKTAADKFVNTPNNVSIDGYACADLGSEPVVVRVPTLSQSRWYTTSEAVRAPNPDCFCSLGQTSTARYLLA
jgi:hypothetical protein